MRSGKFLFGTLVGLNVTRNATDSMAKLLTGNQIELLRQRILASEQFARKSAQVPLLNFLFKEAIDQPVSTQQLLDACFESRPEHGDSPRVEISRLRKGLKDYFEENRYSEPVRIEIPKGLYQLQFAPNELDSDATDLERFWLPFTTRDGPIRLFVNPRNEFWDAQPRRSDRGPGPPQSALEEMYLPLGLMEGLFKFSDFFRSRKKNCIFDSSPNPSPPKNSVLIIGEKPFEELQPRAISLGRYEHERAGLVAVGDHADHYREEYGLTMYCCYARIMRIPISRETGTVALRILAYHSIAIGAAARFLLSAAGAKKLQARLKPLEDRTNERRIFGSSISKELASTVEELGVVLRIMCSFSSPEALNMKPAIPHG